MARQYPASGGKGFRPGLCFATCETYGGTTSAALLSSVALELFHNAFLVHDDVEDGSKFRRGEKTINYAFGIPIAVNVGDAMNVLSIRPLMENIYHLGPKLTWQILSETEHMVRQCVEGQAMELGWVHDNDVNVTEDDYLRMILKKTCWYTCIHPCRIGALIGTNGKVDPDRFNRFGYYMGAAFQIQDDVLNLTGQHNKYGKEIGGDIWEGKRTLILIHLLNSCNSEEKEKLRQFLSKPRNNRKLKDVKWVYSLFSKYNCINHAISLSRQLAGAALREFFVVYGSQKKSPQKQFIQDIVLYMIERDL